MRNAYPIIWALLLVLCSFVAAHLNSDKFLRADLRYLHDKEGNLSIEDIVKKDFAVLNGRALAPVSNIVWLKIEIPKQLDSWPDTILFTGSNETVLSMHAFFQIDDHITDLGFCDVRLTSDTCRKANLQYAFQLPKVPGHKQYLFLKIVPGAGGISDDFYFMQGAYFNKVTIFLASIVGIGSGVFLFVTLLAFILFLSFNERGFLVYGLFYLNIFLSVLVNRGIWDVFKPEAISISGTALMVPVFMLALFFDLLFLKVYFAMRERNPRLNKLYIVCLLVLITTVFLGLLESFRFWAWSLLNPYFFFTMIIAFSTLTLFNHQRRTGAFILTVAWGMAVSCNLIWTFYRSGLIEGFWLFGYYALIGRVIGALVLLLALLHKLQKLNRELSYAKAKDEQGSIIKTLLRTLSHDLSNKTQIIRMSAERIAELGTSDKHSRHAGRIIAAAEDQSKIIEHARKSYTLRGDSVLNLSPVDLKKSVQSVVENYEQSLNSKAIKAEIHFPEEPIFVWAEGVSLSNQVLANLLSNSIKFTHSGGTISLSVTKLDDQNVELQVKDSGIGIPAAILDRMYDESEIVRRPGTTGELGTGNGLFIVRDFMSAYGATVSFQSSVGIGTTATLRFRRFK